MLVQADKVLVTSNPMSELVWSPRKGLGLLFTDTTLADQKSPFLWSTESFNIVLSTPESGAVEDDYGKEIMAEGNLSSFEMVTKSSSKNNMEESSPGTMTLAINGPQRTTEVSTVDINHDQNDQFEGKEAHNFSRRNSPRNLDHHDSAGNDALYPRDDNDKHESSQKQDDYGEKKCEVFPDMLDDGGKNYHDFQQDKDQNSDALKDYDHLEKCMLTPKHGESSYAEKTPQEDNSNKKLPSLLTYFSPVGGKCFVDAPKDSQDNYILPKQESSSSLFNRLAANGSRMSDTGASEQSDKPNDQTQKSFGQHQNTPIESSSAQLEVDLVRRKGKEVIHEENLNKRDDSHESVESCNSKDFSKAKRALSLKPEGEYSLKKLKTITDGSSSGFLFGQGSSFMNWISGVVRSFPDSVETKTAKPTPKTSYGTPGNSSPLTCLDKKKSSDDKTTGFKSFVDALYHPKSGVQATLTENYGHHDAFNDSKTPRLTNQPSIIISSNMDPNEKVLKSQQSGQCQVKKYLKTIPNPCSNESLVCGKALEIASRQHDSCNWVSSSSSIQNNLIPSGDKDANKDASKPGYDVPNKSSEVLPGKAGSSFVGSSWVRRLSPRAVPLAYPAQCNQYPFHVAEMLDGKNKAHLSYIKNDDHKCVENVSQKNMSQNQKQPSILSDYCSSKGISNDKKLKCNMIPILPSQHVEKVEPMTSVLAKRFDAFQHMKTSGIVVDVLCSKGTCFFCGQAGHSLKECSEVKGSEFEDFQDSISSYDATQKSACLCIRCFQLNHWAASCPLLSKKTNHNSLLNGIEKDDRAFNSEQRSRISPKEREWSVTQIVSHSRGMESNENRTLAMHNFIRKEIFDVQFGVFTGIRRLRLSRAELVSGLKLGLSLDGLFLRVRLGNYGKATGGSGYQVACICGEIKESHEIPRNINVYIVGLKCSVDFRFVSNNDFLEGELKAWWSETIKCGLKLPTEEELTKKLQQRRKVNL